METGFREPKPSEKEPFRKETEGFEIKNQEIAQLEEPMKNVLWQLGSRIEKAEYSVVLGEDRSGRLPAFLLEQVLETLYKEKGFLSPETIFFCRPKVYRSCSERRSNKIFQ